MFTGKPWVCLFPAAMVIITGILTSIMDSQRFRHHFSGYSASVTAYIIASDWDKFLCAAANPSGYRPNDLSSANLAGPFSAGFYYFRALYSGLATDPYMAGVSRIRFCTPLHNCLHRWVGVFIFDGGYVFWVQLPDSRPLPEFETAAGGPGYALALFCLQLCQEAAKE